MSKETTITFLTGSTWTVPGGITTVLLTGCGGGGGGGAGGGCAVNAGGGGGGGAGGSARVSSVYVGNIIPGTVYTVTVGTGGLGGTADTGTGNQTDGIDGSDTTIAGPGGTPLIATFYGAQRGFKGTRTVGVQGGLSGSGGAESRTASSPALVGKGLYSGNGGMGGGTSAVGLSGTYGAGSFGGTGNQLLPSGGFGGALTAGAGGGGGGGASMGNDWYVGCSGQSGSFANPGAGSFQPTAPTAAPANTGIGGGGGGGAGSCTSGAAGSSGVGGAGGSGFLWITYND